MNSFVEKLSAEVREEKPREMLRLLVRFRGPDLEAIMGELETLTGMDYAKSVNGTYRFKLSSGPDTSVEQEAGFSLERPTALRLRSLIKHMVIREFRDVNAKQAVQLYSSLFDRIFSQLDPAKHCLNIFTTNYDPAIEAFCQEKYDEYHLCDGFAYDLTDRQTSWNRSVFDAFQPDPSKRNIVLYKIHGSVD